MPVAGSLEPVGHVGFYVQSTMWIVGPDFVLHSLFSTIASQVEPAGWGSRFPALMQELYAGRLPHERVHQARAELRQIREELDRLRPEARVYAYEDPTLLTPWAVPPGATSLADCFVSSHGRSVLGLLDEALEMSAEVGGEVEVRPLDEPGTDTYVVTGEGKLSWR